MVDINATHSFISNRKMMKIHSKTKCSKSTFKVVNSTTKLVAGELHVASMKVRNWYDRFKLVVAPLDDHSIFLGKDLLELAKSILVPFKSILVLLIEIETWSFPMMTRGMLGIIPRMYSMQLVETTKMLTISPCDHTTT